MDLEGGLGLAKREYLFYAQYLDTIDTLNFVKNLAST
tara:strand:- start:411 stop:521 length:111 start_codon:yes stop_codon:yes gene_type:complete